MDKPLGYNKPKGAMLKYPVISGISECSNEGLCTQNQGNYEYGLSDWIENAVRWAENIK